MIEIFNLLLFTSLFRKDKEINGVEKGKIYEGRYEDETIVRKVIMKIIDVEIVYNEDEGVCYTMATCINEHNRIETINIEGFKIDRNVLNIIGAQMEYETHEEYELDEEYELNEGYDKGRIFL